MGVKTKPIDNRIADKKTITHIIACLHFRVFTGGKK